MRGISPQIAKTVAPRRVFYYNHIESKNEVTFVLYIMRHGITDWNALQKLQGRVDIPLNASGRALASAAAKKYRDVHIDVCYCSPLHRAMETAQIFLAGRDVPITPDERLLEMSFGDYEGMTDYFHDPDFPLHDLFQHPEAYTQSIGGAETFDELFARTGAFLSEVVRPQLAAGKDVLIVGHGAMNSALICQIKQRPISQFWASGLKQCELMGFESIPDACGK